MPAIQVDGAGGTVALGIGVGHRVGHGINARTGSGLMLVLMFVMTEVRSVGLHLMRAVRSHRRPAELERKQGEQEDGEKTTHEQESSGYRVLIGTGKAIRSWGFTTSTRGHAPRCGSSDGG